MAASADQVLAALHGYGVTVCEHAGWRTRNHGELNPLAVVLHDSVTGSMTDERAAIFCINGRSDLAGPLYSAMVGHDGVTHLIAHGVTWNAGSGSQARLDLAKRGQMPLGTELGAPQPDDTGDANNVCHGIAIITSGAGPYTPQQKEAAYRTVAAYAHAEGWTPHGGAGSVLGHSEYTRRKSDPALDMGLVRTQVQAVMSGGGGEQYHTVVAGDTLYKISRQYGTTVSKLVELNHLTGTTIHVGQKLRVR